MVFVLWFPTNDIADLTGDRSWEVASARQYHCEVTQPSIVPACAFRKVSSPSYSFLSKLSGIFSNIQGARVEVLLTAAEAFVVSATSSGLHPPLTPHCRQVRGAGNSFDRK